MEAEAALTGISHLSLSVSNLHRSLEFYQDVLKLPILIPPSPGVAFEGEGAIVLVGSVALGLQQHADHAPGAFDPRRTGLDHLSFEVPSLEALEEWSTLLDESSCSHSGISELPGTGHHLHFRDPDGIQLEIFTRAS